VQEVNGDGDYQKSLSDLSANDWIVDSLLGTGIRGDLRPPFNTWVQEINASPARVLAVDVPSGLNCDDGTCGNDCVRADLTVTFVGTKRGFLAPTAAAYTGRVVVAHIGIPELWIHDWLQQRRTENT
jgi:NAD(P)H-hydrate epimerase